jgi:hypothetical protein
LTSGETVNWVLVPGKACSFNRHHARIRAVAPDFLPSRFITRNTI